MPTRQDIEELYLPTGRVITEEWYSKLTEVLHEFKDEIDGITPVISYGYARGDIIPDLDLALNLGLKTLRFKEIWGGWGYFTYHLQSPIVKVLQEPTQSDEAIRKAELDSHKTASPIDHPDGSITTAKLADAAVTTPKIADAAVTRPKLPSPFEFTNLILEKRTDDVIDEGRIFYRTDLKNVKIGTGTEAKFIGISKLSELTIDVDKDWEGHIIKNLGAPTSPTDSARPKDIPLYLAEHLNPILILGNWPPDALSSAITGSGSISWGGSQVTLYTGTTSASYARIYKHTYGNFWPSWDVEIRMITSVYIKQATNQIIWLVVGGIEDLGSDLNTDDHIGFVIVNGTVYGSVGDGNYQSTVELTTFPGTLTRRLSFKFYPGEKVEFYLDGSLAGTITTNLPSGALASPYVFNASIYNSAAENKEMEIHEVRIAIGA